MEELRKEHRYAWAGGGVSSLKRREFLGGLGFVLCASAQPRRPPNVLVFLSDQESQLVDRRLLRLPNREKLERTGVTFTHHFCSTPQCSAARASLWTGRYPHQTGVITNVDGGSLGKPISPQTPNIGTIFRQAGYKTAYFGKWHLGNERESLEAFGFEHRGAASGDRRIASEAASWIRAHGPGPWLAIVSIINPHNIYQFPGREGAQIRAGIAAPASGMADLETRPKPQLLYMKKDQGRPALDYGPEDWQRYRSFYYELIEDADANLGIVLEALEKSGPTIAVYSSDHGDALGAHGLPFKGPFMYEELLRIPHVISWPARIPKSVITDPLTSQIDLLPTLCDLAGVTAPAGLSGSSLRPLIEQRSGFRRDAIFAEYYAKQKWVNPIRTIRTREWKLNVYLEGGRELYHLKDDPHETKNLSRTTAHAAIEKALYARLAAWAKETGDGLWRGGG